jgi:hypothetical protein
LFWNWKGEYSYDPALPFVNKFVIAGDPTAYLGKRLHGLIGQTGLDPLDPNHTLSAYVIKQVSLPVRSEDEGTGTGYVLVQCEFTYADGSKRTYNIPVQEHNGFLETYLIFENHRTYGWNELNRVYAEHLPLSDIPFAFATGSDSPVRLGTPGRVPIDRYAEALDEAKFRNWAYIGAWRAPHQKLEISPDGKHMLASASAGYGTVRSLWLVPLDGSRAKLLAANVLDYLWSADGEYVIYMVGDISRSTVAVRPAESKVYNLELPSLARLSGVSAEGLWYADNGEVLIAPVTGGNSRAATGFAHVPSETRRVYPSHDGRTIAYWCGTSLCLLNKGDTAPVVTRVEMSYAESVPSSDAGTGYEYPDIAWSGDDTKLVVVTRELLSQWWQAERSALVMLTRVGQVLHTTALAPNGIVHTPEWTADGRGLFVQTTPFDGRRIVYVEAGSGRAWDLSGPRWDAWFTLSPESDYLILTNGRGGFWRSSVDYIEHLDQSD